MLDPRSVQSTRERSLIVWRGRQWSVTSKGVETTDPEVPHIIVTPEHFERLDQIVGGSFSPLLPRGAKWLDAEEFAEMVELAKIIHYPHVVAPRMRAYT